MGKRIAGAVIMATVVAVLASDLAFANSILGDNVVDDNLEETEHGVGLFAEHSHRGSSSSRRQIGSWTKKQQRKVQAAIKICLAKTHRPNFRRMTQRYFFCDANGIESDYQLDRYASCVKHNTKKPYPPRFNPEGINLWKINIRQGLGGECQNKTYGKTASGSADYKMGDSRNIHWLNGAAGFDPENQVRHVDLSDLIFNCTAPHHAGTVRQYYCNGENGNERNLLEFERCVVRLGRNYQKQLEKGFPDVLKSARVLCSAKDEPFKSFMATAKFLNSDQATLRMPVPLACYILDQEMRFVTNDRGQTNAVCFKRDESRNSFVAGGGPETGHSGKEGTDLAPENSRPIPPGPPIAPTPKPIPQASAVPQELSPDGLEPALSTPTLLPRTKQ